MYRFLRRRLGKIREWCILNLKYRTRRCSYGLENPDKTFYVIGLSDIGTRGIGAILKVMLAHFQYAEKMNYLPIVDLKNFQSQYSDGNINGWELFFNQPQGYDLDAIQKSKNVVYSRDWNLRPSADIEIQGVYCDSEMISKTRVYYKKYVHLNSYTENYLQKEFQSLIGNKSEVIGVLCRGTDYLYNRPTGHWVQPEPKVVIEELKKLKMKLNFTHIYLATEDQDIYELFISEFGDEVLTNDSTRHSRKDMIGIERLSEISESKELVGYQYISSMNILSKCKYFMGGKTSGTQMVLWMTEGFEYMHLWELGKYD